MLTETFEQPIPEFLGYPHAMVDHADARFSRIMS